MLQLVWLIPLLPLAGATVNGLWRNKQFAPLIAVGTASLSFLMASLVFLALMRGEPTVTVHLYEWMEVGSFHIDIAFLVDPLSAIMLMVVTGVGSLVHIYSMGYMHDDDGSPRFFSYLNLFMFFMLVLVLADNYLLMFVGWEGVGLCSYLLIGFWYQRPAAADAGKKAFIVNRIGDAGFLLGTFTLFTTYGSLRYADIFPQAGIATEATLTIITLLLFIGAVGKSAQIPLYVWLPDAMEGPTPVSALIHAATMVTAGVYMVARSNALYLLAPFSMEVVAVIGTVTALFAATIALVQTDIKRVLAYSTVSQLGFMFLACGVGAFIPAMFHLFTHAFFKGLLFLGAGSVIHACSGEQDIRKMGGLARAIPTTHKTFLIGTIAIAGLPPLAGFWSKDEILAATFQSGHFALFGAALLAATLTAFYMFRLLFLTFYGTSRVLPEALHHLHESPQSMTLPLAILAGFSAVIGLLVGFPPGRGWLHHFLLPVAGAETGHHLSLSTELVLMSLSVFAASLGLGLAFLFYIKRQALPLMWTERVPGFYRTLCNKYWVDEIYDAMLIQPLKGFSHLLWRFDQVVIDGLVNFSGWITLQEGEASSIVDRSVIDGLLDGLSSSLNACAGFLRRLQTGAVQHYFLVMVAGVVAFAIIFAV